MTTTNMMGSIYLETTADNGVPMSRGVEGGDIPWMSGMSYPLDASPYAAESPTTLNSPDTASLDHALFPSAAGAAVGDFSYLDPSFGDFAYPMADVSIVSGGAQLPLQVGRRAVALPGARYAITSAPNPTLYAPAADALWQQPLPPHASPTPFLPTPPMADDLSDESAAEDKLVNDDNDNDEEYDDAEQDPPKRKRSTAGPPSSSSSSSGRSKRRTQAQLRTASRAPRKKPNTLPQRPTETVQDVKAREAHNQVEQQYRKRLNAHFERLLSVLPATGPGATSSSSLGGRRDGIGEKRVSKAEVLDLATERIRALEKQTARLERERRELRSRLAGCVI